jgi:two-component system response regulator YesN
MKGITVSKHRAAVQKALNMIEVRVQDPPSLGELASLSGLGRTYFSFVFKEVTGTGLRDYLIQSRINKAKDLLNDTDLKIKEIAYKVGFRNPDYFCRIFKKKTGVNPTEWRRVNLRSQKS